MKATKLMTLATAIVVTLGAHAAKELVDGYTWEYNVTGGKAYITNVDPRTGGAYYEIPSKLGGCPVVSISNLAFSGRFHIPYGVERIEAQTFFCGFSTIVYFPDSIIYVGDFACGHTTLCEMHLNSSVSLGCNSFDWNNGFTSLYLSEYLIDDSILKYAAFPAPSNFYCKRQYAKNWIARFGVSRFAGYIDDDPEVEIVSAGVRKTDPTVMDVVYKVYSDAATVKVRALAFQDGERSLAKAVLVKTFIDGTEVNVGDAVAANVEHTLSWRVSDDWSTDLAKVKFEVLAVEDDLLPLELQTIPATSTHPKMKISWNRMASDKVFDALLWLYADGDTSLTLSNGQLKLGDETLAAGTSLHSEEKAVTHVFEKMGYGVLTGDDLTYARRVTQLELPVGGVQQFAVKKFDK